MGLPKLLKRLKKQPVNTISQSEKWHLSSTVFTFNSAYKKNTKPVKGRTRMDFLIINVVFVADTELAAKIRRKKGETLTAPAVVFTNSHIASKMSDVQLQPFNR